MVSDPYTLHTLANGLEIVIERMPDVRSAAAGFLVRTGARDETPEVAGISHFLEHMMFKGTPKRSWREITVDFDKMGSSYNAFTSEDRTVYYGWVRQADIDKQLELLADMLRSTLPRKEFDMEKNVILEEIAMAKDSLEHLAFDFLQEKLFAGHPLAWPILGYDTTVGAMTRDQMHSYFQRRYAPDHMTCVIAGNVDPQAVIGSVESLCGSWPASGDGEHREPPTLRTGTEVLTIDRFNQQMVGLTFPSVSGRDPRAETASAIGTILGDDNSRFYWNIIQKGIAPRAGVYHMEYTDCGAMMLYGMCQPDKVDQLVGAMRREADLVCRDGVKPEELQRVKNKRRTRLAVESEVPYHRLTQLMEDMEYFGAPRTVEQMLADVDAVSTDTVRAYLEEFPLNTEGHLVSVGPRHWPEDA